MRSSRCLRVVLIMAVVSAAWIGSLGNAQRCSVYTGNYSLESHEHFTMQLRDPLGAAVQLEESDAYSVKDLNLGFYSAKMWKIKIPGTSPVREVWVTAYAGKYRSDFLMSYYHPRGIPSGWRVEHLEQQFHVGFKVFPDLTKQKFAIPVVYGPTFYSLLDLALMGPAGVTRAYPTFLQTQQVSLLADAANLETGDCMTMATDDDRGNRKILGARIEYEGSVPVAKFIARYIPDQGTTDPNPCGWMTPYRVRFGFFQGGLDAAINWYRCDQLMRRGSFLRSRLPADQTIHPLIRACKFVVGVGTSYGPDILPHGQPDMSAQYRKDTLDYFTKVHGDNLLLYHLGWNRESPVNAPFGHPLYDPILTLVQTYYPPAFYLPQVFPDMYAAGPIPGHKAMIAEAAAKKARSVGYTLPVLQSPYLATFDSSIAKLDADGTTVDVNFLRLEGVQKELCWYEDKTVKMFTDLYVNSILTKHGFAGVYLDALSPAPICYGFHQHRHPRGRNEQLIGINRMLRAIRMDFVRRCKMPPLLINETPSDCLMTDGSALDYNASEPNMFNLFAMTYSGEEFPRFGVVFGGFNGTYGPNGVEYLAQLANALASGARPLILWPEYRLPPKVVAANPYLAGYGFPTSPAAVTGVEGFPEFLNLLNSYSANWDSFWRDIMLGRRLKPLNPVDVVFDSIINPPPPPPYKADPVTTRWRLPGWQPRLGSRGCLMKRFCDKPHPTVFHGLFEPKGQPGQRCLVLVKWIDGPLAAKLKLPANHPAYKPVQKIKLRLCAKNTFCRPGGRMRLFDLKSKLWRHLGYLSKDPEVKTANLEIDLEGICAKVIVID